MPTIYRDITAVLREYPQKNKIWMPLDMCFVVEASTAGIKPGFPPDGLIKDAWNRSFGFPWRVQKDNEGEITCWNNSATVNGQEFKFKVFND